MTSEELRAQQDSYVRSFQPLGDQVMIELEPAHAEHYSRAGIIIPASAAPDQNSIRFARVLRIGPGRWVEGSSSLRCPMSTKPGDRIIIDQICLNGPYPKIADEALNEAGQVVRGAVHVAHDEQILAVVEE